MVRSTTTALLVALAGLVALVAWSDRAAAADPWLVRFRVAQELAERGEHRAAGAAYEALGAEATDAELAAKAWFNAGILYRRANDGAAALRAFETLTRDARLTKHALTVAALEQLARVHAAWFEYRAAAEALERIAPPGEALGEAAYFRDVAEDPVAAERYERYAALPGRDGAWALMRASILRQRSGDATRAEADLVRLVRTYGRNGAARDAATDALVERALVLLGEHAARRAAGKQVIVPATHPRQTAPKLRPTFSVRHAGRGP